MAPSHYETFMAQFWQWRLEESPEFASMCGYHGKFDGLLDSWSLSVFAKRKQKATEFLSRGEEILASDSLAKDATLNLQLLCYDLKTFIDGVDFSGYLFPLNLMEGPHIEFEYVWGQWIDKKAEGGLEKVLQRLKYFPTQIDEKIACMQQGIDSGVVLHQVSLSNVVESLEALVNDGTPLIDAALTGTDESFKDEKEKRLFKTEVSKIVVDSIQPAFQRLRDFVVKIYIPSTRKDVSCLSLPNGEDFYRQCLRFHLSIEMEPQDVHQIGLSEVERVLKEMEKISKAAKFEGSLQEFNAFLRSDPQFYFDDKTLMMKGFNELVFQRIRPQLSKLFKDIPSSSQFPLKLEPTPATQTQGPMGFYLAGTFDGQRPGTFYVNQHNYKKEPKYQMTALALHEAEPGHHLQAIFSLKQGNMPDFRKTIEDRLYTIVPSRFPIHSAYAEGWGLYSESLGIEMGVYDDPYSLHAKYQFEILRSARLVVDTGLHWMGWTREKAINYLQDNTALSFSNIEFEVNRYITWPGQACAYKIGEIKMKALRSQAETELGSHFDVKDFHSVVLESGFVPLTVLEKKVEEYIRQCQTNCQCQP